MPLRLNVSNSTLEKAELVSRDWAVEKRQYNFCFTICKSLPSVLASVFLWVGALYRAHFMYRVMQSLPR